VSKVKNNTRRGDNLGGYLTNQFCRGTSWLRLKIRQGRADMQPNSESQDRAGNPAFMIAFAASDVLGRRNCINASRTYATFAGNHSERMRGFFTGQLRASGAVGGPTPAITAKPFGASNALRGMSSTLVLIELWRAGLVARRLSGISKRLSGTITTIVQLIVTGSIATIS